MRSSRTILPRTRDRRRAQTRSWAHASGAERGRPHRSRCPFDTVDSASAPDQRRAMAAWACGAPARSEPVMRRSGVPAPDRVGACRSDSRSRGNALAHLVQSGNRDRVFINKGAAACSPPMRSGTVPRCSTPGSRQAFVQDHEHSRTAHDRGILGASSQSRALRMDFSRIRRFAFQRCASNSGS